MPRYPQLADRVSAIAGSVFDQFLPKMRSQGDNMVRMHIGDSYLPPGYSLPISETFVKDHPGFNRYCNTRGVQELREALAEKLSSDNRLPANSDTVMLTSGASSALNVSMMGLVNPGEEVLVLTPAWPFFKGMVKLAGGKPVDVPFYTKLYDAPDLDIEALLTAKLSDKTIALYLNSPNNPSGKVLSRQQLQQVADFVRKHNLWLISDEAYDGMTYDEHQHISIASLPEMFERTLSIFSFSKTYMFAGIRLGYMVTNAETLQQLNKVLVHQLYGPTTFGQQMLVEPVRQHQVWSQRFIDDCRQTRDRVDEILEIPHQVPEGAYYFFFPIDDFLGGKTYWDKINECLDSGVSVAPGLDFGDAYGSYIRVCFAGEKPDRIALAAERLNRVFLG